MTEILGTTAMEADQKLDENRLQFKLAAAEARDAAAQLSPKEAAEAMRRKADEARDAARRASEISRLNAAEPAAAPICWARAVCSAPTPDCAMVPSSSRWTNCGSASNTSTSTLHKKIQKWAVPTGTAHFFN